ncbi:MAG: hypothetical protein ABJ231_04940 [Nitratireductor sp.]
MNRLVPGSLERIGGVRGKSDQATIDEFGKGAACKRRLDVGLFLRLGFGRRGCIEGGHAIFDIDRVLDRRLHRFGITCRRKFGFFFARLLRRDGVCVLIFPGLGLCLLVISSTA